MATDHELRLRERLTRLRSLNLLGGTRLSAELEKLQRQLERIQAAPTDEEIWRAVELARHQDRPYTLDYVERLFDDDALDLFHRLAQRDLHAVLRPALAGAEELVGETLHRQDVRARHDECAIHDVT